MSSLIASLSIGVVICAAVIGYLTQNSFLTLSEPPPRIVGIDLGTTYSAVAIYHLGSGKVEVVPLYTDADGKKKYTIPTMIAYNPNGTIVFGYDALAYQQHNPRSTIYDSKRFIGRYFDSDHNPDFVREVKRYPFDIGLDDTGRPYFQVPLDANITLSQKGIIYPEYVGSGIIKYLLGAVEAHTGYTIEKCVLSVPAEFDEIRRNATRLAAGIAGVQVVGIISEPTAAALAYGLHKRDNVNNVVVVDFGGGTLDVSILWLQNGMFVTRALAGNNRLGGQDLNELLLQHFINAILTQYGQSVAERISKNANDTLRMAVESAKLILSTRFSTLIDIQLAEPVGRWRYKLTRDEFNTVCEPVFSRVLSPVRAALADAQLDVDEIDEIVLVGGSTLVPRVRQLIGSYFKKTPNYGVDAELAVVSGDAVQAGVLIGGWPMNVAAVELPAKAKKIHVYDDEQ